MPIRYESVVPNKIYYGTSDGQILGELDSISSVELEAEQYVTDVPAFSQMEFHGSFKIVSNNERKMQGKTLRRGRKGLRTLIRKALKPRKRRDRGKRYHGRI